ncbi:SF0329 family protein [Leptospira sp. GIMC2001]|uniref:SF0329 family protein n=1 Tax=Leptospira sp. GIMC2001 TaxID=1513297 RepID=UPI002348F33D|nr:hypothetical protein [Leptospira sp. GIMC2001]WCL50732.1 hypothetical protein O4O04_07950 [Leptospira sp. GIMC2001]
MSRWSKLQSEIYKLMDAKMNIQIHCSVYQKVSQKSKINFPRYWITLDKEIIWDYPKSFINNQEYPFLSDNNYPYINEISDISNLIREYINTPFKDLFSKIFSNDKWGLSDILKASDRRIGNRRLKKLRECNENTAVIKILSHRLNLK